MAKMTIKDVDLHGKRVLCRVDYNVPLASGVIQDDTRIRASLPTLKYILDHQPSRLVVMSHLGRPKGKVNPDYSLKPVAVALSQLLDRRVVMASGCRGDAVKAQAEELKSGKF